MSKDALTLKWTLVGNTGRITLTAKLGDKVLHTDKLDIASASARKRFAKELCRTRSGISREQVDEKLLAIAADVERARTRQEDPPDAESNEPLVQSRKALEATDGELIELATDFLRGPRLLEKTVRHIGLLGVAGEEDLALALYLIGTSRLLPDPLAGIVMGASSAGKSYVISQVEKLFPPEATLQAHRLSPRALQYMKAGTLIHRFIVAGERSRRQDDDAAEATRALREMIGDGKLSAVITVKGKSGPCETVEIHQDGPVAYVESTTLGIGQIFDEDRTRCLLLSSDESQSQTSAVVRQLAQAATGQGQGDTPDSVIALHHTAQRLLEARDVAIPFGETLGEDFPISRLEVRRTFGHMLTLVKAVALLHQYQRERDEQGRVIALESDYEVVRCRLAEPLGRSLGYELTAGARDLLAALLEWDGEFTVSGVGAKLQKPESTVRGRIKELQSLGQVVKATEHQGRRPATYAIAEDRPPLTGLMLPELAEPAAVLTVMESDGRVDNA